MVVALLYAMQSPCNCFTLSLSGSDSRKSNKLARRQRCYDGDQGVAPVTMVIRTVLRRWRSQAQDDDGHIISQHALQKQVRRPLLCCCKFYVAATGLARTVLTYASKPQR